MQSELRPFHLAFPVDDLQKAREFYAGVMGCPEGRSSDHWIDFDLFGHQIVTHLTPKHEPAACNEVDGTAVPIPHFGVVLCMSEWTELAERLRDSGVEFIVEPQIRFQGQVGEQATMFFLDPSRNALEFKALADLGQLFAK
ncbi:glyoxalase [Pandoraea fibrosis]|uniref:Glyoxalase n=1 Tax=Pandoraea fibrosis TaxID=1891094 RepID=A0ABX6HQQ8_9BURK|nr:VOC family protein [Pandoraea fibrosis]QHE93206.1 glyoxalase [Pandoraea fibrosis]QHF13235.1 glyoxalase [Pandoraea fibrosis]